MAGQRDDLSAALPGYDLGDELGRGGWGVVYAAMHRTLQRQVAIKELPAAFSADPSARDRFRSEARTVASLDHPHVVPLYDFVEQGDTCVFVMELMPGGTLWDRFSSGGLSREASCNITMAVLGALHHAHERGVLHRDIKPENVLFNAAGMPKLADFGIAKVLGDNAGTKTATGMIMGTPAYMAPEQGSGDAMTPATDLYQVGAMLYELLSGRLPFESTGNPLTQLYRHVHELPEPLHEVAPDVPRGVSDVVMKALQKVPTDRFTDAAAFAAALNTAMNQAHGDDWASRSGVRVLATRAMLGTVTTTSTSGRAQPTTPPPTTAPGTPRPDVGRPAPPSPPSPPKPLSSPAPAPVQPTSTPLGQNPGARQGTPETSHPQAGYPQASWSTPAGTPPGTGHPGPQQRTGSSGSRRGPLVAAIAMVAVIAIAITAVVILRDNEGGDVAAEQSNPEVEPAPATVTAAERDRFEDACETNGVDPLLCSCALDLALEELTPEQFLENDRLLRDTGDQITEEVLARFNVCREQLESGSA